MNALPFSLIGGEGIGDCDFTEGGGVKIEGGGEEGAGV